MNILNWAERKCKEYIFFHVKENVACVKSALHRIGERKKTENENWEIRFRFLLKFLLKFSGLNWNWKVEKKIGTEQKFVAETFKYLSYALPLGLWLEMHFY